MQEVSIEGLTLAEALAAPFNSARTQGLGMIHHKADHVMTPEEAEELLRETDYFDYLEGRVIKTGFHEGCDTIKTALFDRDNGHGAAARAIEAARRAKAARPE